MFEPYDHVESRPILGEELRIRGLLDGGVFGLEDFSVHREEDFHRGEHLEEKRKVIINDQARFRGNEEFDKDTEENNKHESVRVNTEIVFRSWMLLVQIPGVEFLQQNR